MDKKGVCRIRQVKAAAHDHFQCGQQTVRGVALVVFDKPSEDLLHRQTSLFRICVSRQKYLHPHGVIAVQSVPVQGSADLYRLLRLLVCPFQLGRRMGKAPYPDGKRTSHIAGKGLLDPFAPGQVGVISVPQDDGGVLFGNQQIFIRSGTIMANIPFQILDGGRLFFGAFEHGHGCCAKEVIAAKIASCPNIRLGSLVIAAKQLCHKTFLPRICLILRRQNTQLHHANHTDRVLDRNVGQFVLCDLLLQAGNDQRAADIAAYPDGAAEIVFSSSAYAALSFAGGLHVRLQP